MIRYLLNSLFCTLNRSFVCRHAKSPMPAHVPKTSGYIKRKKRGNSPSPVPRSEAFALPYTVERATSKPTPICLHFP